MGVRHIAPFDLGDLLNLTEPHRVGAFGPIVRGWPSAERGKDERIDFDLELKHCPTVFVLVLGGWLPPSLVGHRNLLLDRNVLHRVVKHAAGTGRPEDQSSVEELVASAATFNVGMCAFEGTNRREPSRDEYIAAYDEASRSVLARIPGRRLIPSTPAVLDAGYQNIVDAHRTYVCESRFLRIASPMVAEPITPDACRALEGRLFQTAWETGLPRSSFALALALGCLYESRVDPRLMIARRVLKPSRVYEGGDAHNSIADLRALQFTAMAIGLGVGEFGFCTSDSALAKLWCALGPGRGAWNGQRFDMTLSISRVLFGSLNEEGFERLGSALATFHSTAPKFGRPE